MRRELALVFRKDKALSRAALEFIDIAVRHKNGKRAGVPAGGQPLENRRAER
jgi:hypothetical protein